MENIVTIDKVSIARTRLIFHVFQNDTVQELIFLKKRGLSKFHWNEVFYVGIFFKFFILSAEVEKTKCGRNCNFCW